MKRLAILGASGHGKAVADAALLSGWQAIEFFDDASPQGGTLGPWPVIGNSEGLIQARARFDGAVVAIGDNPGRMRKQLQLEEAGVPFAVVIHPRAVVSPFAETGKGSVILGGAVLNPFARIGRGCIINTSASVDHDCQLEDGVHVSPGAHLGGGVRVGQMSWIGIGASVKQGVSIGANTIVGAGAAVVSDVADGLTVLGVPAMAE